MSQEVWLPYWEAVQTPGKHLPPLTSPLDISKAGFLQGSCDQLDPGKGSGFT